MHFLPDRKIPIPNHVAQPPSDTEKGSILEQRSDLESTAKGDRGSNATQEDTPYHTFSTRKRVLLVCIVSVAGLFSPLSSNIYFPALDEIADVGIFLSDQIQKLTLGQVLKR